MGQIVSYLWSCMRPKLSGDTKNDRLKSSNQFKQERSHYIRIPDDDNETRPKLGDDTKNDRLKSSNQFKQERSHYIRIPDDDNETQPKLGSKNNFKDRYTSYIRDSSISAVPQTDLRNNVASLSRQTAHAIIPKAPMTVVQQRQQVVNKEVINSDILARLPPVKASVCGERVVQRIGPYTSVQRILLVGEGDFSFSASLAVAFGSASNIVATSFNPQAYLMRNYSKFESNKMELETRGGVVIHGVDATNIVSHFSLKSSRFDRIVFQFPHTGCFGATDADLRMNRNLVRGFLKSAKEMINEDGEIHVSHKSNRFFRRWDIPNLGCDQGLHLIEETNFIRSIYPGYNTKHGFRGDDDFECAPSKTYKFGTRKKNLKNKKRATSQCTMASLL